MSGIYIPGMEMPASCNACMFDVYGLCLINKYLEAKDELTHSCPLVPVPEHGDLIDRDALNIHDTSPAYGFCVMGVTEEDIYDAPTIIPADPVKEGE